MILLGPSGYGKTITLKYGIEWLKPLGFNNSYALMMRTKQADELNIKYISDLKNYLDSK
ncbi:glycine betaine ABC transporter substrate-binding protein [Chryseobacterium sp. YIM B08800]|uniref:glycine betaine ABC transporter substrate-binding protein n=1 Tax=Chryseobacterium sp. YIM B08800 TaxID=2984136 RepID=UPI00224061A0|nr:glycine betaine ABC transporter substrate-binding protein [Chryseobacterium sp. YIM B08800]